MDSVRHATLEEMEAQLPEIARSPRDEGQLLLINRRPGVNEREVLQEATLDLELGLLGDNWKTRGSRSRPDKSANPDMQINIMNARVVQAVALSKDRWALAGDQLYLDLDLSEGNLPVGSRLEIGSAALEVTAPPHSGCGKFAERFGADAVKFVNSKQRSELRLRGLNAKVVGAGMIRVGDRVRVVRPG